MKYQISFILCFYTFLCLSQSKVSVREIENRFHPEDSIHWTTEFKGLWGDFHETKLILSYNGWEYHGEMEFLSSGDKFQLLGEDQEDGRSVLFEFDPSGRQTAMIHGMITDTRINGNWINGATDLRYPFTALASSAIPLKKFEPQVISYQSTDRTSSMVLLKEAPGQLSGHLQVKGQPYALSISGVCHDIPCKFWSAEVYNENGIVGSIEVHKSAQNVLNLQFQESFGEKTTLSLEQQHSAPMTVKGFSNFSGSVDISYVDFQIGAYETWLTQEFQDWWDAAVDQLKGIDLDALTQSERQQYTWNGWMDIGYISEAGVTGILTLTNLNQTISKHFALDFKKEKMISLESFFKNGVDIAQLCEAKVADRRNELITESEIAYDDWVRDVAFEHIYFRPDGMVILTDYDPVFGTAEIVVPYKELKSELRRKSIISNLVTH
jgi:hypothetical protein